MLRILDDITALIKHLASRQDVEALAWYSNIDHAGLTNIAIAFLTASNLYEIWEHSEDGFHMTAQRDSTEFPPAENFSKSLANTRYDDTPYVLICGIPKTRLDRMELTIRVGDHISSLFKSTIFTGSETLWDTSVAPVTHHAAGGYVYTSGMPFFAKSEAGWAWSAGSPIKRAGILTYMEET